MVRVTNDNSAIGDWPRNWANEDVRKRAFANIFGRGDVCKGLSFQVCGLIIFWHRIEALVPKARQFDGSIKWCLTLFQLYRGFTCIYPCFPGVSSACNTHSISLKKLAAFAYNHFQNHNQLWEGNKSCHYDYYMINPRKAISRVGDSNPWTIVIVSWTQSTMLAYRSVKKELFVEGYTRRLSSQWQLKEFWK